MLRRCPSGFRFQSLSIRFRFMLSLLGQMEGSDASRQDHQERR
jgi:hypothetical protein